MGKYYWIKRTTELLILFWLLVFLSACNQQEASKPLQIGDIAPDFAVKDLLGNVTVLSRLQGSPVILRFFETNCRFCRADTPAFSKFYDENKDKGLEILYIGSFYENVQQLKAFADELAVPFTVAVDKEATLADRYDIRAYPQTVFIGPDRKIMAALLGGVGEAELKEILAEYLK